MREANEGGVPRNNRRSWDGRRSTWDASGIAHAGMVPCGANSAHWAERGEDSLRGLAFLGSGDWGLGSDLVLLSVVIDPAHDRPQALANYARIWKAEPRAWHFLTGSQEQIEQIARRFDMNFYPDEALYVHSFHTIVIDRKGRLAANVEGNDFTPKQLADLVATVMSDPN